MQNGEVEWDDTDISKLSKDQINVSDKEGFVLLHYAVLDQREDKIQELLEAKCGEFAIIIALYAIALEIIWIAVYISNANVSVVKKLLEQISSIFIHL